jgi:hypothetical protein
MPSPCAFSPPLKAGTRRVARFPEVGPPEDSRGVPKDLHPAHPLIDTARYTTNTMEGVAIKNSNSRANFYFFELFRLPLLFRKTSYHLHNFFTTHCKTVFEVRI